MAGAAQHINVWTGPIRVVASNTGENPTVTIVEMRDSSSDIRSALSREFGFKIRQDSGAEVEMTHSDSGGN